VFAGVALAVADDDPLAAVEEFGGGVQVARVAGGLLEHVQHDDPQLGKALPPLAPARIKLLGSRVEGVAAMIALECAISSRYRAKMSVADSSGPTCHSAFGSGGKKSKDSPATTQRDQ
jgi:hypothetical protein